LKVKFLLPARREFIEAAKCYEQQRPGLGKDFRDQVYASIERIKAFPDGWHLLSDDIRRCQTQRFPYGVIYTVEPGNLIIIIAVAHLHRQPDYWRSRI
jgi:plasmid stabilization system protein ParE